MPRFMRKGTTKVYYVPTIASLVAATAIEIGAGTPLHPELAEINGFNFENQTIDTPDMANTLVSKIPGEDTLEDGSMGFYEAKTGTDTIKAALAKGASGYIVIFYRGIAGASPAAADKYEVWPVIVASNSRKYSTGNEAATYMVKFANTAAPTEGTVT